MPDQDTLEMEAADVHDDPDKVAADAPAQPFKTKAFWMHGMFYTRTVGQAN